MYNEDEFLMLSGLQHLIFCQRQCALIHLEGVWQENQLTAEGSLLHARVDQPATESRVTCKVVTGLRLRSCQLGLTGVADRVEFLQCPQEVDDSGKTVACLLPDCRGFWRPYPVEFKHGKPKANLADEIQLCAQALCLEEMLRIHIPEGALFYGTTRRRFQVVFDEDLRLATQQATDQFHELIRSGITPVARYEKKCQACSLLPACLPGISKHKSAKQWLDEQLNQQEMNNIFCF